MMGVWLLSNSVGNKLAGWAAGFFSTMPLRQLFSDVAVILFVDRRRSCFALVKPIKRLMEGVTRSMALEEYKRKRDFKKTPGARRRASRRSAHELFFCVQKHLASHLHYDFRLEHNGVLLSWAVPKGPSLDPKTKRLAMQIEDHPFAYGEFEGVIPEGYGAGIVMLWDKGTWTPEQDDVDAALKKGDLKFTLNGYKLKGSWVLVQDQRPLSTARAGRRRSQLAADQAQGRLGRRRRHRRVRAAQRQERRRLRGHPRRGQPGDLAHQPPGQGRRHRRGVRRRSSRAPRRSRPARAARAQGHKGYKGHKDEGRRRQNAQRRRTQSPRSPPRRKR